MKILIIEDTISKRRILESTLTENGHEVFIAKDGFDGVKTFQAKQPDLVLMDIIMPGMDGYVTASQIKTLCGNRFVPIIFVTSLTGSEVLEKCIECGADDIISGPYDQHTLLAKIAAMGRILKLHEKLHGHASELQKYKSRAQHELKVASHVFSTIIDRGDLDSPNIHYSLSPMSVFSGDLVLCAHTPSGGLHAMLGDFTGHGLSAAVGAMPTADIFYSMTASGYSSGDILAEINRRLYTVLPTGMFCAASFIELDPERKTISVWNGGMPDILVTGSDGTIECHIPSAHMALGVLAEEKFDRKTQIYPVDEHTKILTYSDGVIEAKNRRGRKYGMKRLISLFPRTALKNPPLSVLLSDLKTYTSGCEQSDDVSLLEVNMSNDLAWSADKDSKTLNNMPPSSWGASIRLKPDTLKTVNPVPLILNLVMGVQAPQGHRERIFTILSELFSNALDHGLLGVDSSMKSNAAGFAEYYKTREQRLSTLTRGQIDIKLNHRPSKNKKSGQLTIVLKDSGSGFDYDTVCSNLDSNHGYSGRGIALINTLCESIEYSHNGSQANAVYEWDRE